ncbi:hypothetical protein K2X14_07960 [Acetobacter sp. TBRC 12305]|uniref:Uncharacterized protein n=1 Tax=Acetobacter garciniae TaxID=2817435 RepID=A0A939HQ17_9PROT|nr:hypothetical protein [Acetobacter garciniae]MBO1325261.1 hypothetical protein [Acetobacter garciniae]MBX0344767.1 hypothetical protein [Acetobacter garciniae]
MVAGQRVCKQAVQQASVRPVMLCASLIPGRQRPAREGAGALRGSARRFGLGPVILLRVILRYVPLARYGPYSVASVLFS